MFVRKYSAKYLVLSGIENSAENFRQLSEILSYKKWEGRDLVFDPTGSAIKVLMRYYPDAIWDQPSSEVLDKYLKSLEDAKRLKTFRITPTILSLKQSHLSIRRKLFT